MIEAMLDELLILSFIFVDLAVLNNVTGQQIFNEYQTTTPVINTVPVDFRNIIPPCDGMDEELRNQVIFYNEQYYIQNDFTVFASEKFCDTVDDHMNDIQDAFDNFNLL